MKLEGFPEKKNQLIKRLGTMIKKMPVYNGPPEFAYEIGPYRVNRDGSMSFIEDEADPIVLDTLIKEGFLVDPEPVQAAPVVQPSPVKVESAVEEKEEPEPITLPPIHVETVQTYDQPIVIHDRVVTIQTMVNLLNMIYSKGEILNHALLEKKAFWVDMRVVTDITYDKPRNLAALNRIMRVNDKSGYVRGIEFTSDSVIFTGFPETTDSMVRKAYEALAEAMYRLASSKQWISSRRQKPENEKYYFRNWLNHIGLSGVENKAYRAILLRQLDGNGTYRTKDQLIANRSRRRMPSTTAYAMEG